MSWPTDDDVRDFWDAWVRPRQGCFALAELRDADGDSRFVHCIGSMWDDPHHEHSAPHPFVRGFLFWRTGGPVAWCDPGQDKHRLEYPEIEARSLPPGPIPRRRRYDDKEVAAQREP